MIKKKIKYTRVSKYPPLFRNSLESWQKSEYALWKIIVFQKKLPVQELPAIYLTERDWYARRSSSPLDSGLLSPEDFSFTTGDEDQLDPNVQGQSHQQQGHHHSHHHVESGIGSGADSVSLYPQNFISLIPKYIDLLSNILGFGFDK